MASIVSDISLYSSSFFSDQHTALISRALLHGRPPRLFKAGLAASENERLRVTARDVTTESREALPYPD
jgi:hypothetical protein